MLSHFLRRQKKHIAKTTDQEAALLKRGKTNMKRNDYIKMLEAQLDAQYIKAIEAQKPIDDQTNWQTSNAAAMFYLGELKAIEGLGFTWARRKDNTHAIFNNAY